MSQPRTHRRAYEIAGAFVLLTGVVLAALLLAVALGARWGERTVLVRCTAATDTAAARTELLESLVPDVTAVEVQGRSVGQVADTRIDPDGRIQVLLRIPARLRNQVHRDGRAVLRLPVGGVIGATAVVVRPGPSREALPDGAALPLDQPADAVRQASDLVQDLRLRLPVLLDELTLLARESRQTLEQVRNEKLAQRVGAVLEEHQALVATLTANGRWERLTSQLDQATAGAAAAATTSAIADLHATVADLRAVAALLRRQTPELVQGAAEGLERGNTVLDAAERHWLLGADPPVPTVAAPLGIIASASGAKP